MEEELKVIISAETKNLKQNVEEAKSKIKSFKEQVADAKNNVNANIKSMGEGIKKDLTNALKAGTAAAAATGAAIAKLTSNYLETTDTIDKMSQKIGISKEAYQEWDYICRQSGVDVGVFQNGIKTLTTQMDAAAGGSQSAAEMFTALGLSWEDGNGKLKDQQTMIEETVAALASMEDGTERARLAQELFGKAGTELAPILNTGKDGIEELRDRCHDLGLVMSDETISAGVVLGDTIDDVKSSFSAISNDLVSELVPVLQSIADWFIEHAPEIKQHIEDFKNGLADAATWIQENKTLLEVIAGVIAGVVAAIGLYNAVAAIKTAMDAAQVASLGALIAAKIADAAATALALAPYLLIVAAIAAVIAIIVLCIKHWDEITAFIAQCWQKIKDTVQAGVDKVKEWFNIMKEWIAEKVQAIKDFLTNIGIVKAIKDKLETAKTIIQNVVKLITSIFKGDFGAAKDAILNIFGAIKDGIVNKIENAKNIIKNIIEKIKGIFHFDFNLPKIKLPHFGITPQGWKLGDLLQGSIPKLGIEWYAKGGVLEKPTVFGMNGANAMIGGERGAEAIVPLENNTKWLTKIADMLAARQGNAPIVLQVDGKTFARTTIDSINQLTKQTGSLGLNLV